ncbi:MAG: GNAT family N-acetyltransferase [Phaeodactylibacter sp.]|nr:GNAT family N-acetyltransferase [Phaeodactylibacter sp.]MCB9276642.1 GNAT family N-acetyltransferase [Lewinellaceae bacterium]
MLPHLLNIDTALVAPRTVVRRFREGDGSAFYELVQENHSRLFGLFPQTLESARDKDSAEWYIRERLSDWLMQREYTFGIWDNNSAGMIGMIRIFRIDWKVPKAELGYFMDKDFSGKGLMTESLRTVLRFTFHQLRIEKLIIRTLSDNVASQRVARKCGFRREGDLRDDFRLPGGELTDTVLMGLTRGEFLGI